MKILVTGAINFFERLGELISQKNEVVFIQNELEEINIDVSKIEYVICNGLFLYNDIKKFKSLKYIQVTSAGLDRLPIKYINDHNIKVYNAKGVYSIPMAEWTLCKLLDCYKKSFKFYNNQKNKVWEKERNIDELSGKIATIIGYGSVGKEIARRLYSFDVIVQAVDINYVNDDFVSKSYDILNLEFALNNSDITILTLPLTDETTGLFNQETFSHMKDNSVLINISRGKVINEKDLINEIKKGKFSNVILDAFEEEPLSEKNELWNFDNVVITPHNSFVSNNNDERMLKVIIENLLVEGYIK